LGKDRIPKLAVLYKVDKYRYYEAGTGFKLIHEG
jgi:hypothetical protein